MKSIRNLMTVVAFSLLVLGIPAIASAQWGGQNDPYGRNGGYSNNSSIVRNLKNRSRDLARQIDRELDRSRIDGTRREDQINRVADRFKDAVNDLNNDGNQNSNEVRRVMDLASQLDREIGRSRVGNNVQSLWNSIRNDLRYLGNNGYYDNNDRDNRNNRNSRYPQQNRNGRNNQPNWWPF